MGPRLLTFSELDAVQRAVDAGEPIPAHTVQRLVDEVDTLRYRLTAAGMALDGRLHSRDARDQWQETKP